MIYNYLFIFNIIKFQYFFLIKLDLNLIYINYNIFVLKIIIKNLTFNIFINKLTIIIFKKIKFIKKLNLNLFFIFL